MDSFPSYIEFNKSWRSYQARVLNELEEYLDDDHLHIIAAPGSGKTVLGLEVLRRLNKPTLILSPTLPIRDQWVDRFMSLFCPAGSVRPEWISNDIRSPGFLTVSTYQGLHSVYVGRADEELEEAEEENGEGFDEADGDGSEADTDSVSGEELIAKLKEAGVRTIVADEAHHLRSEWWKVLIRVKNSLEKATVVALTATPPYDATPLEWDRYQRLCGPVDSEISVPELVLEKNLCPHQDYVYLSTPTKRESAEIKKFRSDVKGLLENLYANEEFTGVLENHHCVQRPEVNMESILDDPAFFSSVAIFLYHAKGTKCKELLKILGVEGRRIPKADVSWIEILLTGCLYSHVEEFAGREAVFDGIRKELSRAGAIERRKVMLSDPKGVTKLLVSSMSKLESIGRIVEMESESLGSGLRMVILTDFIRKADMPSSAGDMQPLRRIGVVPIFEQIRRAGLGDIKLGILSGSLVVIPCSCRQLCMEIAGGMGIDVANISFSVLRHNEGYCEAEISGQSRKQIVALITEVFNQGGVTVLVGTKSLLGEGWDAPSVNSLVLASFVGSYMLSNQMRGRAIRTQYGNPDKTANIWHLVCVEAGRKKPGTDLEMLSRRFKAFVGVSFTEPVIENGMARLNIDQPPYSRGRVGAINEMMAERAMDRARLAGDWQNALKVGDDGVRMVEEIKTTPLSLPRSFVFGNTIMALVWQGIMWGGHVASQVEIRSSGAEELGVFLVRLLLTGAVLFALAAVIALPKCLKALWLFLRHGPVAGSIKQIGTAVLRTLTHIELIDTSPSKMSVKAEKDEYGLVRCRLVGATTYEKSLFLDALQEVLGPIDNPRYLMVRKSLLGRFARKDYHSVPQLIGRKKEYAEYFARMWAKYVGATRLIYTRSVEGRRLLVKARGASLSAAFQKRSERVRSWK